MAKRSLVWVLWNDACFKTEGWHSSEIPSSISETETSGFLVRDDKDGIVIAVDYDPQGVHGDECWRGVTFIPKGMVQKKKVIKIDG